MNRREFYVSRSGEDLLRVLSLVKKIPFEELVKEKLGKEEIMERLDQLPVASLLLADKIAREGGSEVPETEQEEAEETARAKPGSGDAVAKALARIAQTVEDTVRRLNAPLVNEVAKVNNTLAALDQNKAGKGEMNAALTTLGKSITDRMDKQGASIAGSLDKLASTILSEKDVKKIIAEVGVPRDEVRNAVMQATEEQFEKLRQSVSADTPASAESGSKSGRKVVSEQEAKDQALLAKAKLAVRVVKSESAEKVFGVKLVDRAGKALVVDIWNDPDAEDINPDYVFNPEHLRIALYAMQQKPARNVFMFGETGTGKTEFARQLSARLGRRLFRVNFENGSDSYNFIGGERAKNASTVYQYGTFTLGLKHPGAIVLLDELCFAKPGHVAALHATLEYEGALTITETGEKVKRAEGVIIFAADNTNGTGDRTGRYDGLYTMNGALRRRFSYWMQFDYPPEELEADIIARKTGVNIKASRVVVALMRACRAAARTGALADSPSLPHAIAFCELVQSGKKTREAYEQSVVLATSPEYAEKLQELYTASFNESAFDKAV